MVTEPRVVQFWSEIILVISAQIALHSVQLPLLSITVRFVKFFLLRIEILSFVSRWKSHQAMRLKVFKSLFVALWFDVIGGLWLAVSWCI